MQQCVNLGKWLLATPEPERKLFHLLLLGMGRWHERGQVSTRVHEHRLLAPSDRGV